jgi:hypothetical protein
VIAVEIDKYLIPSPDSYTISGIIFWEVHQITRVSRVLF